jgi:hypothetical protein
VSARERYPLDAWYVVGPETIREWLTRIHSGMAPVPELGRGLLYRGQTHTLYGPSDAGKSLLAAAIVAYELNAGRRVLWIDFEQGGVRVLRRLVEFGADGNALLERFHYLDHPHGAPTIENIEALGADVDIVIVDATTRLLDALGLSSIADTDIESAYVAVFRPLAGCGAAVLLIDHVRNDPQQRNGMPIGSGRKIGAADVALSFEAIPPGFAPGRGGRAKITVKRDRDGAVRPVDLIVEPDMEWRLEPRATAKDPNWMPTTIMQTVSEYLEAQGEPVSRNSIEKNVRHNSKYVREAIDHLVEHDYVTETAGRNRAKLCASTKPYRAPLENGSSSSSSVRPEFVPDEAAGGSFSSSPPYKGDELTDGPGEREYHRWLVQLDETEAARVDAAS